MEKLLARAGKIWNGAFTGPIEAYCKGWWISGVVEMGLQARMSLYRPRPCPDLLSLTDSVYDWLGCSTETRKLCQELGLVTVGDLTTVNPTGERAWSCWAMNKDYLQLYMHQNAVPVGQITLAVGQLWQVISAFGEPDKIYEILGLEAGGVWYKNWWSLPGARRVPPQKKTSFYCRNSESQYIPFDDLFLSYASFRQLYMEPPKVAKTAAFRVTRKIIRWKCENRPALPSGRILPPPCVRAPNLRTQCI